jgi:predicted nucleic acid-binding protein
MVLRLALDVNVWVNHYLSLSKGRQGSAAQRLVHATFDGHCRLGPIQPIISHVMLDTLRAVLVRVGLPDGLAEAARNAVESSAIGGIIGESPYVVFGGGVQPIRDAEDGGVLETAIAGNTDLLITHNIKDFMPGPRADIDAETVRIDRNGGGDVLLFRHSKSRFGIVIASVFAAKAWLLDGVLPPEGILERFLPSAAQPSERFGR